jgi:hypothetical protein
MTKESFENSQRNGRFENVETPHETQMQDLGRPWRGEHVRFDGKSGRYAFCKEERWGSRVEGVVPADFAPHPVDARRLGEFLRHAGWDREAEWTRVLLFAYRGREEELFLHAFEELEVGPRPRERSWFYRRFGVRGEHVTREEMDLWNQAWVGALPDFEADNERWGRERAEYDERGPRNWVDERCVKP